MKLPFALTKPISRMMCGEDSSIIAHSILLILADWITIANNQQHKKHHFHLLYESYTGYYYCDLDFVVEKHESHVMIYDTSPRAAILTAIHVNLSITVHGLTKPILQ